MLPESSPPPVGRAFARLIQTKAIIEGTIDEEQQWKVFSDEISEQFKHDVSSISLSEVDMSDCGRDITSKSNAVCEALKKFFARHLKKYNHPKHNSISKLKHRIPKLKWSVLQRIIKIAGVFTLLHLGTYFGNPAGNGTLVCVYESDEQVSMWEAL
ncbi:hypothetical protein Tco_0624468 [Tanacetum coccineum]|uniref:Uncharacterized protein n=1 Tax=Tanacetum coccineum TaxID=301880 RepID=A0ABQ4WE12_9ASTR